MSTATSPWFWLHFADDSWCWASPHVLTGHCACGLVTRLCVLAARALCYSARGTSLVAPWHVGSLFPNEGLNLRPLRWTARKSPSYTYACISSLDECLFRPFAHLTTLYDRVVRILFIIYRIQVLIRFISDLQILPPILWVVFSLSWWCPTKQLMFWNLMILFLSFAVISKKPFPHRRSQRFITRFSSYSFSACV